MTEIPDERPRPTPRPRPGAVARPGPRPRVAGSRRDRDERDVAGAAETAAPRPASRRTSSAPVPGDDDAARPRRRVGALVLALLCLLTAAGTGLLLWQR